MTGIRRRLTILTMLILPVLISPAQNIINPKSGGVSPVFVSSRDSLAVQVERLGLEINTPYSEFSAFQISDHTLYFSALRPYKLQTEHGYIPDEFYTQLYHSKIGPGGWSLSELASKRLNAGKYHVANATFSHDGKHVWFTRCTEDSEGNKHCRIFESKVDKRGRWTRPKPLPPQINPDGWSSTQPFVHLSPELKILFFSSDRPGGMGGYDIWYSRLEGREYGTAVNLGSIINTEGNEHSPFYFNGALYFSSNKHPGLGGFDIFSSQGAFNSWSIPLNLGEPLNSALDELNFSINSDSLSGYFTSNRPGSLHLYEETCCYDIYHFEWEIIKRKQLIVPEPLISSDSLARLLLPISLYFDNDQPDPRSRSESTTADYFNLLSAYAGELDRYKAEYSSGLSVSKAQAAEAEIAHFFDSLVLGGFEKLELLASYIYTDLSQGQSVRIRVSGFASPLNTSEYNYNLSRRRIGSLINYLSVYRDGVLRPYLSNQNIGARLVVEAIPVGENRSRPFVSDNPNDVRNSVYSMAAALERRIEISSYESEVNLDSAKGFGQITLLDAYTNFEGTSGRNIIASLPFINSGTEALNIQSISSSCNCIRSSYPEIEIKTGEKGIIYLLINSAEPGEYLSELKIEFTPSEESLMLHLRWIFKAP
jgi:outer membrane protein OmpA-like peptidoglycan-associated protein